MQSNTDSLGIFEGSTDIGKVKHSGTAAYNSLSEEYRISGSGTNMWFNHDEFHFVWKRVSGHAILYSQVRFLGKGTDPHRKAGIMIRKSLEPGSPYISIAYHGDGLVAMQYRTHQDSLTREIHASQDSLPILQLDIRPDTIAAYACREGNPLAFISSSVVEFTRSGEYYVGLFVCSHNPDKKEEAVFTNTRFTRPAADDFIPYTDYIGARLETVDVETGRRSVVFESELPIEAPNWSKDGSYFIVNARGRLFRIAADGSRIDTLDTGFATSNNNDHGFSPDGNLLAISHHAREYPAGKNSVIYTLPANGGVPQQVTTNSPSYWHGWSPDGKYLIYTAQRHEEWNIYRIPAAGGEEIPLTQHPGLDDGSEYSSDGKYIWFNSNRSGSMEIWRMLADGSEPVQITNDGNQNWFAHESPLGDQMIYLSYPPEVNKWEHPYYKHVTLKLLQLRNGEVISPPKVLVHLYGGQGTINVPSWSPDGKKIAFVSNTGYPY